LFQLLNGPPTNAGAFGSYPLRVLSWWYVVQPVIAAALGVADATGGGAALTTPTERANARVAASAMR